MKDTENQACCMSIEALYFKGWTIRQAARELHRSPHHVAEVVRGRRISHTIARQLELLPQRDLQLRRRKEVVR